MKRITILLVLVLFLPVFASAEGEYYTIREIREQAETLMAANGGTVNIQAAHGNFDVPIEVPDVDRVPIIKIDFPLEDQMPEAPENGILERHLTYDDKYLSGWIGQAGSRDELYGESFKNASRVGQYGLDARADGSPLSMEESIRFAEQLLDAYREKNGWDFHLRRAVAESRQYKAHFGRDDVIPDTSKALDETGYYDLDFEQTFHGIPFNDYISYTQPSPNRYNRNKPVPLGDTVIAIFSPDLYEYVLYAGRETAVLVDDVPFCGLDKVLQSWKKAGKYSYRARPSKIRFVYVSMFDPEDKDGELILVPVWALEDDMGPDGASGSMAYVNAQTGEFINADEEKDRDGHRGDAVWITWDDVK